MKSPKVSPGDSRWKSPAFNAAWCNNLSEVSENYHEKHKLGTGTNRPSGQSRPIKIRNKTGGALIRGNVVEIGIELLSDTDHRNLWFEGNDYNGGVLAVVRCAVPDEQICEVVLSGETTAIVDVTDTDHEYAVAADGETVLTSAASGDIRILSPLPVTGEYEVAVLLGAKSSGGSSTQYGRVYDDLAGYAQDDATITPATVRFLPWKDNGDGSYTIDTAATPIAAIPSHSVTIEIADDACGCVGETAAQTLAVDAPGDARYVSPQTTGTNAEDNLTISGFGADPASGVAVTLLNPINDAVLVASAAATVAGNGTWSLTGIDLTGLSGNQHVKVRAIETDVDSFAHKPVYDYFYYAADHGTGDESVKYDTPAIAPDLKTTSDLGSSNSDNRTSDTTPTIAITTVESDTADGPAARIYVDGVEVYEGTANDFQSSQTIEETLSTLAIGTYQVTFTITHDIDNDDIESGHSPPLVLTIAATESSGSITATVLAAGAFETTDAPFAVDGYANESNTTDPSESVPTAPTTLSQPTPPIALGDNAEIPIEVIDGVWQVAQPQGYARQAEVTTDTNGTVWLSDVAQCPVRITAAEKLALDGEL